MVPAEGDIAVLAYPYFTEHRPMGCSDPNIGSAPGNCGIPIALQFPSAITLAAEGTIRAEESDVVVDLHFPDKPPFVNMVLTADAALDLSLRLASRL
jgi:hypothetical protein